MIFIIKHSGGGVLTPAFFFKNHPKRDGLWKDRGVDKGKFCDRTSIMKRCRGNCSAGCMSIHCKILNFICLKYV